MSHSIRIAALNADTPGPNTLSTRGSYGNIFHELFSKAAAGLSPNLEIESTDYNAQKNEFPASLSDVDVVLVTGSAASANDDLEWVRRLDAYILDVYTNHAHVKIFAACFGHQLVCQSLLGHYGVSVDQGVPTKKYPRGWELGVQEMHLDKEFQRQIGSSAQYSLKAGAKNMTPKTMRMQYIHAEFVSVLSIGLPRPWINVGSTDFCAVQGLYCPGRVLTLQGHFEYDRYTNREEFMMFGASWKQEEREATLAAIDADDDTNAVAEMVVQFMLEKGPEEAPIQA